MTDAVVSTCDVVDCEEAASSTAKKQQRAYLDAGHDRAMEFAVCSAHFGRITGGECPVIVPEQSERSESDGRPALLFE